LCIRIKYYIILLIKLQKTPTLTDRVYDLRTRKIKIISFNEVSNLGDILDAVTIDLPIRYSAKLSIKEKYCIIKKAVKKAFNNMEKTRFKVEPPLEE